MTSATTVHEASTRGAVANGTAIGDGVQPEGRRARLRPRSARRGIHAMLPQGRYVLDYSVRSTRHPRSTMHDRAPPGHLLRSTAEIGCSPVEPVTAHEHQET